MNFKQMLNPEKRLVLSNAYWLTVERFFVLIIGFLFSIIAARSLGPDLFGTYNYLVSFVALFLPVMTLGLEKILVKALSDEPGQAQNVLSTAFIAKAAASLCISVVAIFTFQFIDTSNSSVMPVLVLLLGQSFYSLRTFDAWFQYQSRNRLIAIYRMKCVSFAFVLKLMVLYYFQSINILCIVILIEHVIIGIGHFYLYRTASSIERQSKFQLEIFLKLFSQSKYLILSGVSYLIYLRIDVIMLSNISGSYETGVYAAGAKITEACQVLPEAILLAMFPKMLAIHRENRSHYYKLFLDGLRMLFLSGLVLATVIFLSAPYLIQIMFGSEYAHSSEIVRIHIWSCCFLFMRSLLSQWLIAEKFAQFSLVSHGLGAVTNIGLNFIWIPKYGAIGAAYATVVSYFISSFLCLILSVRTWGIFFMMCKATFFPYTIFNYVQKLAIYLGSRKKSNR
jgi:O-antigen/teichoic acid export membrane protein